MATEIQQLSDKPGWSIRNHIETTPEICGGKPRIAGSRITVQNIALWHERGAMSADEIVATYPQLGLADVYAALAYYWDHRDEIRAQMDADEKYADSLREKSTSLLSQRLSERRETNDMLPSG